MNVVKRSPRVDWLKWGTMAVEGRGEDFKDVKAYPGGARAWDWNETGTGHTPGIQPADVKELLENGAEEIVLSQGVLGRLQVAQETLDYLKEKDIPVHVLGTKKAVEKYNQLREGIPVGGLFHSTC